MSYMCMGCYEVYDRALGYCPKPSCRCEVEEIDELILPAVKILNEKGYYTTYCCSGHLYDNGCNIYVIFNHYLLETFGIGEIKDIFKNLPTGWKFSFEEDGKFSIQYMMNYELRDKDKVALYEEIVNANLSLLKFVKTLPKLEC